MISKPYILHEKKIKITLSLIKENIDTHLSKILIVGCGTGVEVLVFEEEFGCNVIGIEPDPKVFDPRLTCRCDLRQGDVLHMEFESGYFDLIYSFHVLEHIPNFKKALDEMHRVLRPGGYLFLGTPNRLRVVGYLGSENATLKDKVWWNILDWKARLQGKFKNEFGAHAGFGSQELKNTLMRQFPRVEDLTLKYYLRLYQRFTPMLLLLDGLGMGRFLFPAIFFIAKR